MPDFVSSPSTLIFPIVNSMHFDDLGQTRYCRWYQGTFRFQSPGCNHWRGRLPAAKSCPRRLEQRQE